MFLPLSRIFSKLLCCLASSHLSVKSTRPSLSPFMILDQLVSVQSIRFFARSANKSEKISKFRNVSVFSCFVRGPTKFVFQFNCLDNQTRFIAIVESNIKTQSERFLWISIPAAKTLLERLNAYQFGFISRSAAESWTNVPITQFEDVEMNNTIVLKLVKALDGRINLQILSRDLTEGKVSAIFIPLDVISEFQGNLAYTLHNEKFGDKQLKPYLPELTSQKPTELNVELRDKLRDIEALKAEVDAEVAELMNLTGSIEDRRKEIVKRKEKFIQKWKEIQDKYRHFN